MKKLITLLLLISFTAIFAQNNRQAVLLKRQDSGNSRTRDGYWNLVLDTNAVLSTVDSNGLVVRYATESDTTEWMLVGDTLYPKNTDAKVGIGTTTPQTDLDVAGSFRAVFGGDSLLLDTVQLPNFGELPGYGFVRNYYGKKFGLAKYDASGIGSGQLMTLGWADLINDVGNFIYFEDTTALKIRSNSTDIQNQIETYYKVRKTGNDTVTEFRISSVPFGADQMFALSSSLQGRNYGFEVQINPGNIPKAKIFATDSGGNTNLSVIEIGTEDVQVQTSDGTEITKFNSNGVVLPILTTEPSGEQAALYFNPDSLGLRLYNGSYWQEISTNSALKAGCGDSTYSMSLTQNVPAPITNPTGDLLSEGVDSTRGYYYSGDTIFASSAHGWADVYANISVDGQSGSSIKLFVYQNGASICNCGSEIELSNNRKTQLTFISSTIVSDGDYFQLFIEDRGQNSTTVINNVQFRIH
jgi:hypothetical protein